MKTNAQMLGLCAAAGDWKPPDLFSNSLGRAEGTTASLSTGSIIKETEENNNNNNKNRTPQLFHGKA